jgi:hypothetical protein
VIEQGDQAVCVLDGENLTDHACLAVRSEDGAGVPAAIVEGARRRPLAYEFGLGLEPPGEGMGDRRIAW